VIRNVVIHVMNEQPLMADLYALPESSDAGLVCTNLRTPDGKRPTFVDRSESTFFFPYLVIRFLEIPEGALERHRASGGALDGPMAAAVGMRSQPGSNLPVLVPAGDEDDQAAQGEVDLEIDEDFLQRIRDI
jgi:hypothetical protein